MKWIFLAAALTLSFSSHAYDIRETCTSCSTESDFASFAKSKVNGLSGHHTVMVVNFDTGIAKKYRYSNIVQYDKTGDPVYYEKFTQTSLSNTEISNVALATKNGNELKRFLIYYPDPVDIPESISPNVYGLVGRAYAVNAAGDYYLQNIGAKQLAWDYVGAMAAVVGKAVGVKISVPVRFSDGSIGKLDISGIDQNGKITFRLSAATIDKDGNNIPTTKDEVAGEYIFNGSNGNTIRDFINAIDRLGINVTVLPASNIGGTLGSSGACTHRGNVMTCVYK
jgi:hypothetical protein